MKSLVSVIICVYNAGMMLREALTSILGQTYKELQVIIVDDGSTDRCMETIKNIDDARIIVIQQENRGKPAALNRALGLISGEFYAVQDADDISYSERIEKQLKCMARLPNLAAVYTGHDMIIEGERRIAPISQSYSPAEVSERIGKLDVPALDPTGLFRVSLVKDILYNERLPGVEGVDYMLRIGEIFPIMVLGECLYSYRILWNSYTRNRNPLVRMQRLWDAKRDASVRMGLDIEKYLGPRPNSETKLSNRHYDNDLASDFILSVKSCLRQGMRGKAISTGVACASLHPFDGHYLKALVYSFCPEGFISFLKNRRKCRTGRGTLRDKGLDI